MAEYIEREAALRANCYFCSEHLKDDSPCGEKCADYMKFMKIPAAAVRPVVQGKWKYKEGGELCADGYYCTACGTGFHVHVPYFAEFNFCPNCGADMRGGKLADGAVDLCRP